MAKPILYIIAGCNGAGKTTASKNILPELLRCHEFINADEIAYRLNPSNPDQSAIAAGRIMLSKIKELLTQRVTFAIETTLATKTYTNYVSMAQEAGYDVVLLFFWLDSPELAKMRVATRVAEGGHNIPADVVERRYWRGLNNLFELFIPIVDVWSIYDNYSIGPKLIADSNGVINETVYFEIMRRMEKEDRKQLLERLKDGLEKSYIKLLQEKTDKNQPILISENGEPKSISSQEALKRFKLDLELRDKGLL